MISSLCVVIRIKSASGVTRGRVLAWDSYDDSGGRSSGPEDRSRWAPRSCSLRGLGSVPRGNSAAELRRPELEGRAEMKMKK